MPIVAASPMSGVPKTSSAYGYGCGTGIGYDYGFDHIGEGEEELDENTYDSHYSHSNGKKTPTTAPMPILLDFAASPIDAELDIDIDIELHSAKYPGPKRPSLSRHASANAAYAANNANANNANSGSASASASSVFDTPPGQMTGLPMSAEMAWSLSKQHVGLRHTATIDVGRSGSRSRSSSTSSEATIMASSPMAGSPMAGSPADDDWRRPTIMAPKPQSQSQSSSLSQSKTGLNSGGLNAFAPPWPLPETTPKLVPTQPKSITDATAAVPPPTPQPVARAESNTLPPPSSLPSKPIGSLPPVFVKREAALLPQGMALPHVPPMGQTWMGENALSGNDKRRRTSETGSGSSNISRGMSGLNIRSLSGAGFKGEGNAMAIGGASSAPSSRRPDKLVRLGERLKENANRPLF